MLGLCSGFVFACCCITVVTQPLLPPAFNRPEARLEHFSLFEAVDLVL